MTDFATLKIRVDALEAKVAGGDMDKLTAAGGRAEKSMGAMSAAASVLKNALAAVGVAGLAADIIKTNAAFQSMEASLKIATGSIQAAGKAMESIKKFAAETPFTLGQSVEAFLKLKNLGLDPSIEALRSYGNTSASTGKNIMQMVEAVSDAATGEFERLKEFGIKASVAGENVAFTFQKVTTTVKNSAAEIEKYLQGLGNKQFAGAMAEQMKTLNGQWANLQDNIDALYVAIGKLGANNALTALMTSASEAVVFLNQNLETIVDVLGAGVIAWGTYTAVTVAAAAAQAVMSGTLGLIIGLVATTTAEFGVLAGAEVAAAAATAGLATAFNGLTAAMLRNPFGVAAVALAALAGALFLARQRTDDLNVAQISQSRTSKALDVITADVARTQGTLATATGEARAESLAHVQALKAEAEKLLQVATAASIAAEAKAYAAERTAKAALAEEQSMRATVASAAARSGVEMDFDPLPSDKLSKAEENFNKLRAAADAAGKDFRETTSRVADLRAQINSATKPIDVASSATGKLAGAARDAGKAADEFGKGFGIDLINNLVAYGQAVAETFGTKFLEQEAAEWEKLHTQIQNGLPDVTSGLQAAADANVVWNGALRETIDLLDMIGGSAQGLGDIAAVMQGLAGGDWSGARGPVAGLLKTLGGVTWRDETDANGLGQWRVLREELVKGLDQVFGGEGTFSRTMNRLLESAGTGYAAGQLVNGQRNSGIGSMVGGALGGELGKFAGAEIAKGATSGLLKAFGAAAGPLGSIAGGIIGGLVGGLFKKSATGSVILNGANVVGTSGNGGRAEQANQLGSSLTDALNKIAAALGVTATGNAAVSIGMKDNTYRVDPTGAGRTKESDVLVFSDAASAVKAALKIQIEKGVFEGLSEGMKKYILSGDLETQLGKLATYRSALDAADHAKDPQAYELKALETARSAIMETANAVGASLEEINKLEEYYGNQRADIVEKYAATAIESDRNLRTMQAELLRLNGDDAGALRIARDLERESMTTAEKAVYALITARKDELAMIAGNQAVLDRAAALDKQRNELQIEILRAQGKAEEALALQRQMEMDAADPLIRTMLGLRNSFVDFAEAAEKANAAAAEAASQSRDLDKRLARATGNTALADAMDREDFLAQFGADLQAKALAVWNAEHKKVADTANKYSQMLADAAGRMGAANDNLAAANDNLASSMAETLDKFRGFSDGLRKFRDSVLTTDFSPERNFGGLSAQYNQTAMMARRGNEAALSGLPDIARQYLDAAKARSSTREDYERIVESVLRDTGAAIRTSDAIADGNTAIVAELKGLRADMKAMNERQARAEEAAERNQRETREAIVDIRDGTVPIRTEAA